MHVADRVRHRLVQLGHAARHRARVPVLEHAAGRQPERIVLVRAPRAAARRAARRCSALPSGIAVELVAGAGLHVGVGALAVAPQRLLAVRPPASAGRAPGGRCRTAPGRGRGRGRTARTPRTGPSARRSRRPSLRRWRSRPRSRDSRELVDLAVAEQHVEQRLAAVLGLLGEQLGRPHLLDLEALGELHQLPQVGARLARRVDQLVPEVRAPLGVAVGAFLLDPHRRRQDQVGGERGDGRDRRPRRRRSCPGCGSPGSPPASGWRRPACCC